MAPRSYAAINDSDPFFSDPIRTEVPSDRGRIRHPIWIDALVRYLRVVTLAYGQTIHNAFPDRRFKP